MDHPASAPFALEEEDLRLLGLIEDTTIDGSPVVPPIYQTSLFTFPSYGEMFETYAGRRTRPVYSRGLNPTVRLLETKLAGLEGGEDALALSSGMAAISSAILSVVRPGDRILSVRGIYPDAFRFMEMFLADFGVVTDYVDGRDLAAIEAALPDATLLYLESPVSWTFETHDVGALAALARRYGVVSLIDNSWATPLFQRPLALGCDLVVHSLSKYLSGHSDVVAGAVIGSAERIGAIRTGLTPFFGAKLSPMEAFLVVRGLRSLPLRMRQHETAALEIARRLAAHRGVEEVFHPALAGPLPAGLTGTSGLFSARLREGVDVERFCDALRLFRLGVSWGGHESLALPSDIPLVQVGGPNSAQFFAVPERLMRFSIGLEPVEALWQDLEAAFAAAG